MSTYFKYARAGRNVFMYTAVIMNAWKSRRVVVDIHDADFHLRPIRQGGESRVFRHHLSKTNVIWNKLEPTTFALHLLKSIYTLYMVGCQPKKNYIWA